MSDSTPDGKLVVTRVQTPDAKSMMRVWEVATGKEMFAPKDRAESITDVSFSRDSKLVSTLITPNTLKDGVCRFWDSATGEELFELGEPRRRISACSFSSDSTLIIAKSENQKHQFYSIKKLAMLSSFEGLKKIASQALLRKLTKEERSRYLHESPRRTQ